MNVIISNEATNKRHSQGFFSRSQYLIKINNFSFSFLKFRSIFTMKALLCESYTHDIWDRLIRSMISNIQTIRISEINFQFDKKPISIMKLKQFIEHAVHRNQMTLFFCLPNSKIRNLVFLWHSFLLEMSSFLVSYKMIKIIL